MTGDHRPASSGSADEATTCDDRALLARLRAGEDAAFGELFSRHSDAVRRLALGMVTDRAEADDLTAEAFFRVLQAIRRGSGPVDNVRGYLLTVVRRVAWEWSGRRRDVPVTDEELDFRAGPEHDDNGRSTERTLITRAFTSLPERWRSVLWKVEVEGERPAVVAGNLGLSPNATAALARRARQGLRAAYLQAHLAAGRGATNCRGVLEKLGAYTAGSLTGSERRKVGAHLAACADCTDTQAELQEVCSGLRAHAAFLAVPVAGLAVAQHTAAGGSLLAGLKAVLTSAKFQVVAAAGSAAAVGALALAPWAGQSEPQAYVDLDGSAPIVAATETTQSPVGTSASPVQTAASSVIAPAGQPRRTARTHVEVPTTERSGRAQLPPSPGPTDAPGQGRSADADTHAVPVEVFDASLPLVSRQVSVERRTEERDDQVVVSETMTTTLVNSAGQTSVATTTAQYLEPQATVLPPASSAPATRPAPPTWPSRARTPSG
ncbi:sigma-70 family RNA polymerase sigma factor [Actinokineospora pegani]|uniref:sigma-70 family RNA polymerase sigma factor n=1 Tax=Actinokineospora pegani TaxID=2654637 RepID=UPI0018D3BA08|nr:sigma-70 family RNA polymerase sigma factor [Actinokineospora pegani]